MWREGLRRLALLAGIVGAIAGIFYSWNAIADLHRRWNWHTYFREEQRLHPAAVLRERRFEIVLETDQLADEILRKMPPAPPPGYSPVETRGDLGDGWTLVEEYRQTFPPWSNNPPSLRYYLSAFGPIITGFAACWGAVRSLAWVADGFKADDRESKAI
jgi:hypothetical protein